LQCAKFGISTEGTEIYITHFPCLACTKMLLQAGIKKIYYLEDYYNNEYALKLISDIKIALEKVELSRKYFDKLTFGRNNASFLFETNED
jgi:dCMP deaminase